MNTDDVGWLRKLGLFNLEKKRLCEDVTAASQYLKKTCKEAREGKEVSSVQVLVGWGIEQPGP